MDFAEFVRALARWRQGRHSCLVTAHVTRSTHLLARRIAEEYGREKLVPPAADIFAWGQTGGVGREGRSWSSPAGKGVYASLIRHLDADRVQGLPLAISAAVCESLNRLLGDGRCRLKWPNDLQVGGRKLGGLLIDAVSPALSASEVSEERPAALAIISLGVNHSRELESFEAAHATSLEAELLAGGRRSGDPKAGDPAVSLDGAVAALVDAVDAELAGPREEGLVERYQGLSVHRPGDEIHCRAGGDQVIGSFLGFDRHGFLRLDVGGKERRISSGIVSDEQVPQGTHP